MDMGRFGTGLRRGSWEQGELFELLSLMTMGACLWIIGARLGVFDSISRFALAHDLMNLVMLSGCMGLGVFAAAIRKSFLLRRAMHARIAAEAQAESIARHDALTGLANRRLFHETLAESLRSRQAGEQFAVLLIDLDRFKPVNDVHGHAAGNAVLCAVADRLRSLTPPKSMVARLGGDEFAALVPYESDRDALIRLAQQIIAAVRNPIPWNEGQLEVGATIGIALAGAENVEPEALLHAADVAMYQGKREGRGAFRFFQAEMDVALKARARLEADLRLAITRGEIAPYFQPIVSLPAQDLIGFEVLARWNHPTEGLIAPDNFIPIAEETGMIADLFYGLLRQACSDARNWPPHLQLAVNISPQQLQDQWLPERILGILAETGFTPSRLEVEITETALINDLEAARSTLTSLQNSGVKIALDDFGTGYSSLYHLRELRFNKLKIDRSYVTSLKQGSERAKLVDAIIQLGASLSLQTTAEGIETATSLDWLSDQGCNFGQGYFFGAPMPKDAADRYLDSAEAARLAERQAKAAHAA
ncbi:bifunctional diguanylate cyclase/phosphodiesterase [Methylocapsa sp. S129]|uniref:putative bifunctional diguanylate cyclase/phosphodiesterase n=1 Tax=Methylocapsa sp. S129 TaxID=1641869 RepID=UPI001FEF951C|nr:EAL domain-containing protein [Methylocapsa sp. S129]